jgi:hypothetical protein
MNRDGKRLGLLPGWRIFTYVIIATNLLMLSWLIASVTSAASHHGCSPLEAMTCTGGSNAAPGVAALPVITICGLVNLILGALWLNTRLDMTRTCRACGRDSEVSAVRCRHSVHVFRNGSHQPSTSSHRHASHM